MRRADRLGALVVLCVAFASTRDADAEPLDPVDFPSLGVLAPASPLVIDTDVPEVTGGAAFTGVFDGNTAVFAFDSVDVDVLVRVVGHHPVALLSHGTFRLGPSGLIAARARGGVPGAGGYPGSPGVGAPDGRGPGAGHEWGSAGGGGGHGGDGGPDCTYTRTFCSAPPDSCVFWSP